MNPEIEKKLWSVAQEKTSYTEEIWNQIVDSLLEDFQTFTGQKFHCQELSLYPNYPSFNQWIWGKYIKGKFIPTAWSAVIGGSIIENENGNDNFFVSLTLFLFDVSSKQRLCLNTGESFVEFVFQKQSDGHGYWQNLGWFQDANYEWENVEWEDFQWDEEE